MQHHMNSKLRLYYYRIRYKEESMLGVCVLQMTRKMDLILVR
jgi:hypothetical protein